MGQFRPGVVTNPNGRPKGSRNKRTEELWNRLEARGDKDPADVLSSIATNEHEPKELRIQAATALMPYKYGKCGTLIQPRYIEEPLEIPRPTTIAQTRENIVFISDLKAQGRIDLDTADSLIADNKAAAGIMIEELKLAAQGQGIGEQIIKIEGGLPALLGCDVIMPQLNGHNGHTLDLEKNAGPTLVATESAPLPAPDPAPSQDPQQ